jgi:2-methylcitrate dehydratase
VDPAIAEITDFATNSRYDRLPDEVQRLASLLLLDTIGCAAGGYNSDAAAIARRVLTPVSADEATSGSVFGADVRSTPEMAAFANTCAIRFLDYNDFYPASHPSDMVGGLLALARERDVDGSRFLSAMVVAYEVSARISDATKMRRNGWDQGFAIGLGTAAGVGHLLGCSAEVIGHALSITATANVHLRNTRAGNLSMWKGAATAYAVRNGVFAVQLAREGMTGPESPFEGRHGLFEQITGPVVLDAFPGRDATDYRLMRTSVKYWPVEYNAQAAIWAALKLREDVSMDDLDNVSIGTYWTSWHEIGSEPAKWDPLTRETADHSMPFIFAAVMRDGTLDESTFEPESFLDATLRPAMAKISVYLDDECDAQYPAHIVMKIKATETTGKVHDFTITDPRGYWTNPMDEAEVQAKFMRQADKLFGPEKSANLLSFWSSLSARPELGHGFETVA